MSAATWAEAGLAAGFLGLAVLARATAAARSALAAAQGAERRAVDERPAPPPPAPPARPGDEEAQRAEILAAELAWAAFLACSLVLAAHAGPQLFPGTGVVGALVFLSFAALVVGDAIPVRLGERQLRPGGGGPRAAPQGLSVPRAVEPLVALLARPFRSAAAHLARRRAARPPAEAAAADEAKLLQRLFDATTNGETAPDSVRDLLGRLLHLRETPADSIMCPRSEIVWIGHRERPAAAALLMRESGHSRLPICGRDLDDVVGILQRKDVFLALHGVPPEATAGVIGREPLFVEAGTALSALLGSWRHHGETLAIVRDPAGRVVGLITLNDVLGWLLPPPGSELLAVPGAARAGEAGGPPPP